MSRSRVEERAQRIYTFLAAHLNTPYTIDALLRKTQLRDGSTTRAAIKRARELATEDGLCLPVACWDNGNTYCVTDVGAAAIDSTIHLGKIAQGVGVTKDVHDAFIRSRMSKMTSSERAMFNGMERLEAGQREQRAAYIELLKAMTAIRRESGD